MKLVRELLLVFSLVGCAQKEMVQMEMSNWETHCFGRVLLNLPKAALVTFEYRIWGEPVVRLADSPDMLDSRVRAREEELSGMRHDVEQRMLVDRVEHGRRGVSLFSWDDISGTDLYWVDSFFVAQDPWRAYQYSGPVERDRRNAAEALYRQLASGLAPLAPGQIPAVPGFCVDGGWFAGSDFRAETVDASVRIPDYPGVVFSLLSSTQGEVDKDTLLDRGLLSEAILIAQGAKRMRKGKRSPGGIPGGEYLMASTENGQRIYTFAWEAPGKAMSVTEPYVLAELQVLGQSVVDEDSPYRPAFESDGEALRVWDAIIGSIRPLTAAAPE